MGERAVTLELTGVRCAGCAGTIERALADLDGVARSAVNLAAETVTITWPDSDTWAFTGFMTNYAGDAPHNGLMTGTATVKVSGDVTISSASASGSGA